MVDFAREQYCVGWICMITEAFVAAQAVLDEEQPNPANVFNNNITYRCGLVGKHRVVIASPERKDGSISAEDVAQNLDRDFGDCKVAFLVGIGGGAPSAKEDIRLGDVVISMDHAAVPQFDSSDTPQNKVTIGHVVLPPVYLSPDLTRLRVDNEFDGIKLQTSIDSAIDKLEPGIRNRYSKPDSKTDVLHKSSHTHMAAETVDRENRPEEEIPTVHFGLVVSSNSLMRDAEVRDRLAAQEKVMCFENEAARLMTRYTCIVICGICDYSDGYQYQSWKAFAAMAAATMAKEVLNAVQPMRLQAAPVFSSNRHRY